MKSAVGEMRISKRTIRVILRDPEKSARAVNLVHVSDTQPGIRRVKKGRSFSYVQNGKPVKDQETLQRIKSLVIPPAWENVWICALENGHLQATGLDTKKRKQYRYHPSWSSIRNQTKFFSLYDFGKSLSDIRDRLDHDLALAGLPLNKVLATVVSLMEQTSIRVGSNAYEKLYGSYGLTTLQDKHIRLSGGNMQFCFKGKKGVSQNISLHSKRLARIVKQCRDIPGKELFQYYDEAGNHKAIDSGMVNQYLKEISGKEFTAKDFRTWSGTLHAITAFRKMDSPETKTSAKQNVIKVLDHVAGQLGNTRAVCKKYYVHPVVIALYENNALEKYFFGLSSLKKNSALRKLNPEEKIMMRILEKEKLSHP